jgi:hypothetical protein
MFGKTRRGQFFSFDVIAGAFIFMIAFFLIAFYWLNAQTLFAQQEGGDIQREAARVSDYLLSPGIPPADSMQGAAIGSLEGIHLVKDGTNTLDYTLVGDFKAISDPANAQHYQQVKEKLGIPRYDFNVTFENDAGAWLRPPAGKIPSPNDPKPKDVANEERIVIMTDASGGNPQLAKMRVQVWR